MRRHERYFYGVVPRDTRVQAVAASRAQGFTVGDLSDYLR